MFMSTGMAFEALGLGHLAFVARFCASAVGGWAVGSGSGYPYIPLQKQELPGATMLELLKLVHKLVRKLVHKLVHDGYWPLMRND